MEIGHEEAIFFPAIVEEVVLKHRCVQLQLRRPRAKWFLPEGKNFNMNVIWLSDDDSAKKLFIAAQKLCPGDEIYVDCYHSEWCNPCYRNIFRRCWNLLFG